MGRFDEKIMLVTGATSGIGRAVAIRAAKEGATVIAVGRNEERGAAVVAAMEEAGGKGEFMKCDVSNKDAVKALFAEIQEKYGKLDVAVNNAGIVGASKTVEELEDDDWFQVIDANLNSCFFCCREEVKLMQPSGGAIVNVSSVAGMRGFPSAAAYVASKHAVSGLTKAVAVDYATKGITCNAICPAGTDTPLTERSSADIKTRMAEIAAQGKDPMECCLERQRRCRRKMRHRKSRQQRFCILQVMRQDTLQVPLLQVMVDLLHTKIKRNKEPLGSQSAPERFLSVS